MRKLLVLVCLVSMMAGTATAAAKRSSDMRFGVGFSQQLSDLGLDSFAARFWVNRTFGVEGLFGFMFGDNRVFDFGFKFLANLKREQNMNVYAFGLVGMENYEFKKDANGADIAKISETTTSAGGGFGVEFFLQGLPNLSFGAETGLAFRNPAKVGRFQTFGNWLSSVGMRYYF